MTQQTNLPSFEKLKEKLATDPIMERYRQLTQKVHQNEKLLALYDEYIKKQKMHTIEQILMPSGYGYII